MARLPYTLGKIKFTAPNSWADLTVKEYLEVAKWANESPDDITELWHILTGVDKADFLKATNFEQLNDLDTCLNFMNKPLDLNSLPIASMIKIGDKECLIGKSLNTITYGQFIEAKKLVRHLVEITDDKTGVDPIHVTELTPQITACVLWGQLSDEPYTIEGAKRFENEILKAKFVDTYPATLFFWGDVARIDKERTQRLRTKADEDAVKARFEKVARWDEFATIDALAKGDILKYNDVLELTIGTVINKLEYDKDKAEYQERLYNVKKKKAERNAERNKGNNRRRR